MLICWVYPNRANLDFSAPHKKLKLSSLATLNQAIAAISLDDHKLPEFETLPKNHIVKLDIPIVEGAPDLLYSTATYNAVLLPPQTI
jgi:hypothetical protein